MATNQFSRHNIASVSNSDSSKTTLFTMTAGAGSTAKASIIIGCLVCNKTATNATINIQNDTAVSGHVDVMLVNALTVPANSSVELGLGKYVLMHNGTTGDVLKSWGSAASTFDISLSILEDVN